MPTRTASYIVSWRVCDEPCTNPDCFSIPCRMTMDCAQSFRMTHCEMYLCGIPAAIAAAQHCLPCPQCGSASTNREKPGTGPVWPTAPDAGRIATTTSKSVLTHHWSIPFLRVQEMHLPSHLARLGKCSRLRQVPLGDPGTEKRTYFLIPEEPVECAWSLHAHQGGRVATTREVAQRGTPTGGEGRRLARSDSPCALWMRGTQPLGGL